MKKEFPLKNLKSIEIDHDNGMAVACYEEEKRILKKGWYKHCNVESIILVTEEFNPLCGAIELSGFNSRKEWSDGIYCSSLSGWRPANMEEVEKLLIKEAEKRGFKEGVKISIGDAVETITECTYEFIENWSVGNMNALCVKYCNGDIHIWNANEGWAEIIEEKKPLYTNSYGTEFFEGDDVYWVTKRSGLINHDSLHFGMHMGENSNSEIMTERECHQWLADNWDELKK